MIRSAAAPRETYNVPHRIPWHWQVPAYLVTKGIGAGAFMIGVAGVALGLLPEVPLFSSGVAIIALLFIAITTGLLVWDLDRPERFLSIVFRPQWKSWLARGAFVLIGFSLLATIYLAARLFELSALAESPVLVWGSVAMAGFAAVYTAFLFAQAEGRDLWQSSLLPVHMFVQSVVAGAAALLVVAALVGGGVDVLLPLSKILSVSLGANLLLTLAGEFAVPHASEVAAMAARLITHGRYAGVYRASVVFGALLPLALLLLGGGSAFAGLLAGTLALAGLYMYEWAYVMAPQQVPNN